MGFGHNYTMRDGTAVSSAITVLQMLAGATCPFVTIRASVSQRGSTTSAQEEVAFVRKGPGTGATVTTAIIAGPTGTLFIDRKADPSPSLSITTTGTGIRGTAEGTDGDIFLKEGFNVLNGWLHLPVPEKRIHVQAATAAALKFITAPASQNWDFVWEIQELGSFALIVSAGYLAAIL